jgi:hypothetical protein
VSRKPEYARFQLGDACLYNKERYMIIGVVWVDPFPGVMTWHIERLLERHDPLCQLSNELRGKKTRSLEEVMQHGIIRERDGNFYQEFNISEDELEDIDAPPTWEQVDQLRAQIVTLSAALTSRFRRESSVKRKGW